MDCTGYAVNFVVAVDGFKQGIDRGLTNLNPWQASVIEFVQRAAEYRPLTTAAGYDPAGYLLLQIDDALPMTGPDIDGLAFPIKSDLRNFIDVVAQALVAKVAKSQLFGKMRNPLSNGFSSFRSAVLRRRKGTHRHKTQCGASTKKKGAACSKAAVIWRMHLISSGGTTTRVTSS